MQYVLKASRVETLIDVMPKFLQEAQNSPLLRFVDSDLKINRPEVSVRINRAKAAELDIPVADIGRTLQFAFGDSRLGYFLKDGKQYQIIGQLGRGDRNKPDDLKRVSVRARGGLMVSLDNLITFDETISPASIYRFNRNVSATISGQPAPGYTLGQAIDELDRIAKATLPPTVSTDLAGQSRDFRDSAKSLVFAFLFALVLIYLVLAAQFESFIDPVIILLTVPLSVAGALISLWLTDSSLNVFSQIGIIMLIGLVTKNGILIVEFANQRKRAGLSQAGGGAGRRGGPPAPDPDDQPGHHAGRPAHRAGPGQRVGQPQLDGHRGRGRALLLGLPEPLRRARGLLLPFAAGAGAERRGNRATGRTRPLARSDEV